jgi:hypothetical protein|tara:strand:- start:107 stop:457 length:351 start_codon:yes stop_codon:yes gene_type:complete
MNTIMVQHPKTATKKPSRISKPLRRSTRKRKAPTTYISEFESENIKRMYLEDIPDADIDFALNESVDIQEVNTANKDDDYDPKQDLVQEKLDLEYEKDLDFLCESEESDDASSTQV